MCSLLFTEDGTEISTVAELRRMWPIVIEQRAGVLEQQPDEDYCLCGIDIPGTARANGARVSHDSTFDEYTVRPVVRRERGEG